MVFFSESRWINAETGARSDVPHNMIYPLKETRPNLHFMTGVYVKHVTFDEYVSIFDDFLPSFWKVYSVRIGRQELHILSTHCSTPMVRGARGLSEERSWSLSLRVHLVLLVFSSVLGSAPKMYSSVSG